MYLSILTVERAEHMLKLLVFCGCLTFVTAVPLKLLHEEIEQLKIEQIKLETLYLRQHSAQSNKFYQRDLVQPTVEERSFYLPNNTWPLHYDIYLRTSIHTGDFIFNGVVRINIDILEDTNSITLHSRLHIIQGLNLFASDGSSFNTTLTFTYDSDLEFLTILSSTELVVGQEFIIEVTFIGIMNDFSQRGFMTNSYEDPATGQPVWMGQTHFQPVNTRHAFPCFDELRYRQTITLRIEHDESYRAISTMPVSEVQESSENFVITVFATTPRIPIIYLTFSVNRLDFVSATDNCTPAREWRVFARPEAIHAGQADHALRIGVAFLEEMENIFNIRDYLPKSDQVAVPQFIANGNGNWGFISVREGILLQTNNNPTEQHLREMIVAHEYTFLPSRLHTSGSIFIRLNEGLATLYENILNDIVFPEKRQMERFLIDYYDASMELDIFDNVQPMTYFAQSRDQIRARFNFIINQKAALVLRMFQEALTDATWTKGLTYYLLEKQLQTVTPEDLFEGLQKAYDEDFPESSLDVGGMMNPWVNLRGYPVVTVSRTGQGLIVTQEGFRTTHDELFNIPLNYATATLPNFEDTIVDVWLTSKEMEITLANASRSWTDDDWIIFNLRDTGYYVTNYDDVLWDLIINALLNDEREEIHFLNRGTLFADLNRFIVENYDIRTTLYLDLIRSLEFEGHPHVWVRSNDGLRKFEARLRGTNLHQLFLDFLHDIMAPVYSGTEIIDFTGRNIINNWSCLSGVGNCLTNSLAYLIEYMETGTIFEYYFRCSGFMTADRSVWMHFFNFAVALELTDDNRRILLRDLLCTRNAELVRFYLDETIDTTNGLTVEERQRAILFASSHTYVSYNTVVDFILEKYETVDQILLLEEIIEELAVATNTQIDGERVLHLTNFIPAARNPGLDYFLSLMQNNFEFIERNSDDFQHWFENRAKSAK